MHTRRHLRQRRATVARPPQLPRRNSAHSARTPSTTSRAAHSSCTIVSSLPTSTTPARSSTLSPCPSFAVSLESLSCAVSSSLIVPDILHVSECYHNFSTSIALPLAADRPLPLGGLPRSTCALSYHASYDLWISKNNYNWSLIASLAPFSQIYLTNSPGYFIHAIPPSFLLTRQI